MFGSLGPVDNTTLRERVYRTLKQAILEVVFHPARPCPRVRSLKFWARASCQCATHCCA